MAIAVAVALGGGACGTAVDRPAGITERWLQAVGDQGRDKLRDHSTRRAAELGDPAAVAAVLPPADDRPDDERYFPDLEVGEAHVADGTARVPFRVTARTANDDIELALTAVLERRGHTWFVTAIDERRAGERVPSEGGDRPATATTRQWVVSLGIGLLVLVVSVALIEMQPDPRRGVGSEP